MKGLILFFLLVFGEMKIFGQVFQGKIIDENTRLPVEGASLRWSKGINGSGSSGKDGLFELVFKSPDTLIVTRLDYMKHKIFISSIGQKDIRIRSAENQLQEVSVSTGYYKIPKERVTGAFGLIDSSLLNRDMRPNILQRLENLVPGVQFIKSGGKSAEDIRIRGLGTINSDRSPLVILDNFPYEGDIANINANDIESISILKDAAAASIWGARAGNGVIVITSKQLKKKDRTALSFLMNTQIGGKPDFSYNRSWLPSKTVMDIEKYRYNQGHYTFSNEIPVPLYVELLKALDDGSMLQIDFDRQEELFRNTDILREVNDNLYQFPINTQYAISLTSGSKNNSFVVNGQYNRSRETIIGNSGRQVNLNVRNRFSPSEKFDIIVGLAYSGYKTSNNGFSFDMLGTSEFGISPYYKLRDESGLPIPIVKDHRYSYAGQAESEGLIDWLFRPLADRDAVSARGFSNDVRINVESSFQPFTGVKFSVLYQNITGNNGSSSHYTKNSYYVRDLVNRFTQDDGTMIVPYGGILETGVSTSRTSHFGRIQGTYNKAFNEHTINLLGGMELRHSQNEISPGSILYNFDDEYLSGTNVIDFKQIYSVRPSGNSRIPAPKLTHNIFINRDISYYGNASYEFGKKYVISGSLRWDGSNLFGVKANQKGVPLWSVGGSWKLSEEGFFPLRKWLPSLRFRATYGVAGNMNRTITHYPVITYGLSPVNLRSGRILSVGNPALKWENVSTTNLGIDWQSTGSRLSGTIDWYLKNGNDLIGNDLLDPTKGVETQAINYAGIKSKGMDIQLTTVNLKGEISWQTVWQASWTTNKVTNYRTAEVSGVSGYFSSPPPAKGVSIDMSYAIPWFGLSSEDGYLELPSEVVEKRNYNTYYRGLKAEDLKKMGTVIPTAYGSLRNTIRWQGLELGALISWKAGYVFRRSTMPVGGEYYGYYHRDYYDRWKKTGDERKTYVPAFVPLSEMNPQGTAMNNLYGKSEILFSKGDHVRLEDIVLFYTIPEYITKKVRTKSISLYVQARNLGIIWRSNNLRIDPNYVDAKYVEPKSFTLGIRGSF